MKKSGFWNFWFSFVPGCGQLYLGATKKGVILLSLFFGIMAFCKIARIEFLMFLLPIIWFYSFFDALNSISLSSEQLEASDKEFSNDFFKFFNNNSLLKKRHVLVGVGLIIIGAYMIFINFMPNFLRNISWVRDLIYNMPTLLIALAIIVLGGYLLKSKPSTPDFIEYKGGKEDGRQQ